MLNEAVSTTPVQMRQVVFAEWPTAESSLLQLSDCGAWLLSGNFVKLTTDNTVRNPLHAALAHT